MIIDEEDYLEHFGVKGMKWGIRRKDRSLQGRADKLRTHAENRPTRGNIRKAQRMQLQVDRRNRRIESLNKSPAEIRADRTSRLVGIGAGVLSGLFLTGRTGSVLIGTIGGSATGLLGAKALNRALEKDRATTAAALKKN